MKKYIFILLVLYSFTLSAQQYAVVDFSVNYMREEPDYTAELGNQSLMGTVVEVLERQGYWVKIKSPEPYTAWVNALGLVMMTKDELANYLKKDKYICIVENSYIYKEADAKSERVSDIVEGDLLIKDNSRPAKDGFVAVQMPSGRKAYAYRKDVQEYKSWLSTRDASVDNLIAEAKKYLGLPYMWGGTSPKAFDCSGFLRHIYFMNAVLLPRNTSQQARLGRDVYIGDIGNRNIDSLKRGDILFFAPPSKLKEARVNHVGLYLGDGLFIHSSQKVRINSLYPTEKDSYNGISRLLKVKRLDKDSLSQYMMNKSPFYMYNVK